MSKAKKQRNIMNGVLLHHWSGYACRKYFSKKRFTLTNPKGKCRFLWHD
jgi:hypothetical protein